MTQVFTGTGVSVYQMLVVKRGLLACKDGFRLNRAYTPKNLRAVTERLTGQKFKARDYDGMVAALEAKIAQVRAEEEGNQ